MQAQLARAASPVLRALAAAISLGSGASLGPEGPSVDIGRSFARALGSLLRSKHRRLFPLIAAGSGAGAGALLYSLCFPAPDTPYELPCLCGASQCLQVAEGEGLMA